MRLTELAFLKQNFWITSICPTQFTLMNFLSHSLHWHFFVNQYCVVWTFLHTLHTETFCPTQVTLVGFLSHSSHWQWHLWSVKRTTRTTPVLHRLWDLETCRAFWVGQKNCWFFRRVNKEHKLKKSFSVKCVKKSSHHNVFV